MKFADGTTVAAVVVAVVASAWASASALVTVFVPWAASQVLAVAGTARWVEYHSCRLDQPR